MRKRWMRPTVDAAMALLYVGQMVPGKTGNPYHELAGLVLAALIVAHHMLNARWVARLTARGGWYAWVVTACDVALLGSVAGMCVTGVLMSRFALAGLAVTSVAHVVRPLHTACTYAGFLLAAFHAGLHASVLGAYVGVASKDDGPMRLSLGIVGALLLAGSAWAAMRLGLVTKLSSGSGFPDGVTPLWLQVVEHMLLACPFVMLGAVFDGRRRAKANTREKGSL